jgi:hypothetical protein
MKQLAIALTLTFWYFPQHLSAGLITLSASDDAMVQAANPSTNFGSSQIIRIGSANDPAFVGSHPAGLKRGLFRFDVSGITSGTQIIDATFSVYQSDDPFIGNGFRVYEALEFWTEDTVTWNSQPSIGQFLGTMSLLPSSYVNFSSSPLTQLIKDWVNGNRPNHGLAIYFHDETFNGGPGLMGDTLQSKESNTPPILTITVIPEPSSINLLAVAMVTAWRLRSRNYFRPSQKR